MILGIKTDSCGRCIHYHNENDIAALQCARCKQYYACFKCHDLMCDHTFVAMTTENSQPVMCGNCKTLLTYKQYQQYQCPFCQASFNPRCASHKDIYFK
ncbi:CHY zinc finger protein [Snodgrassella alvi]